MASTKLNRYLAIQRAKGAEPDSLELSRLLREDVQAMPKTRVVNAAIETRKRREAAIGPSNVPSSLGGDVSEDVSAPPNLGQALGSIAGNPTAMGMATKGTASGILSGITASQMGFPVAESAVKGALISLASPISMLSAAVNMGVANAVAANVAANVAAMFGNEAAQEAADAISGRSNLSSLSSKGQLAYSNALVALQNAPKSPFSMAWSAIRGKSMVNAPISTVTPFSTNKAITEAFNAHPLGHLGMLSVTSPESLTIPGTSMISTEAVMAMSADQTAGESAGSGLSGDLGALGNAPGPGII